MNRKKKSSVRRVLVVDDNPAVLKLIGTLFEDEGMAVCLAKSVAAARDALLAPGEPFDLVLSDISMPVETGFDLLDWIKHQGSPLADLPVLLTTAQLPEAENRLKGFAMGAVDYVVRPIDLKELVVRSLNAIDHFRQVKGLETMLQTSENLALTGRLLAASTHEIKNLAGLVHLCSDRLERSLRNRETDPAEHEDVLRCLSDSSALLTDVARNVSNLLDPSTMRVQSVALEPLVGEVARLMHARVRPVLLEVTQMSGIFHAAQAHPLRLKQVLINFILNAADAIQELDSEQGGRITLSFAESGDTCSLIVKDNGIGFRTAGVRTEFEPFATTKKLRGGQGLGLWLCSRLIQSMGGLLRLSSEGVGKGATATVVLKKASLAGLGGERDMDFDIEQYLID